MSVTPVTLSAVARQDHPGAHSPGPVHGTPRPVVLMAEPSCSGGCRARSAEGRGAGGRFGEARCTREESSPSAVTRDGCDFPSSKLWHVWDVLVPGWTWRPRGPVARPPSAQNVLKFQTWWGGAGFGTDCVIMCTVGAASRSGGQCRTPARKPCSGSRLVTTFASRPLL